MNPFTNADVPPPPELEYYGIEKDKSKVADFLAQPDYTNLFLRHAFNFNLRANMLGICTLYHESYCYHLNAMDSPQAVSMALLLGNLVDSAKGGFQFDQAKWAAYLKKNGLRTLSKPAYKDRQKAKPTDHLIDHLVFVVAKRAREKALREFDKHFVNVSPRDDDLSRIRNEEVEEAKSNKPLAQVLKNLDTDLKAIQAFWGNNARHDDADEDIRPPRKSGLPTFRTIVEKVRTDFLNIKPTLDEPPPTTETSDRISSWQRDHARGRSSYWDLVKASVAFHHYCQTSFIWHMAGVELGEIKATARGRGLYRVVVGEVFDAFKLDRRVADGARRRELFEREGGAGGKEEDDDEDEFGVWDWGIDDC